MQLLTNHLGYECRGPKLAVIKGPILNARYVELRHLNDQRLVLQLPLPACGPVAQWHTGEYASIDFSHMCDEGEYYLQVGEHVSHPFRVTEGLLHKPFSDLLHYFKSQRCSGRFDSADRNAKRYQTDETIDVHGGWYDASGDVSKYLSHLSYANHLNPQQIPMVVWNMLASLTLQPEQPAYTQARLLDEALYGCDFLTRMQSSDGYFYMTVFDKWSKNPQQRDICAYKTQDGHKSNAWQAAFRQGGGVAIAALAKAANLNNNPSYCSLYDADPAPLATYLAAAEQGYWHLREHNLAYLDNGEENIIDEYCALLAATELYRTTQHSRYLAEARIWAERLCQRQGSDQNFEHFWLASAERPYYHAAEAGLPVIALLQYLEVETDRSKAPTVQAVVENALRFELNISQEVHNPFGYPRQYVQPVGGDKQSQFFIPHNNESGYWWQGENARLASLVSMALLALPYIDDDALKHALRQYASQSLNWILGLNPYDMSMLDGHGHNNPDYLPELGFYNAHGGVCNGITSGFENEADIAFKPEGQKDDMLQNWRWGEQWIPHGAWLLLAIAAHSKEYHDEQL
ncbi:glycoside hydrolase family 9 protein [Thaumasiovibrio sp. DFM-14]|uniref:glycoside hydrolase family 9 protein n=1 Tax=Thaumasiovibrio sp. DFM-14 TaxID=3384792 RepID=UPI0039A1AA10